MWAVDRAAAQRRSDHLEPLADQGADVQFGLGSSLHADDGQPSVGGECGEIALQIGGTHDVEDEIGAVAVGSGPHALYEIFAAVGDDDLRAQFAAERKLGRCTGRCRDTRTERSGDLDCVSTDTACPAVDQYELVWRQSGAHHDGGPHRARRLGQPGRGLQADTVGNRQDLSDRGRHVLGIASAGQQGTNLLSHRKSRDTVTNLSDDPGDFQAQDVACPRRGGYLPAACSKSARLTPAAQTSISTSPFPAVALGTSCQVSRPASVTMACMDVTLP